MTIINGRIRGHQDTIDHFAHGCRYRRLNKLFVCYWRILGLVTMDAGSIVDQSDRYRRIMNRPRELVPFAEKQLFCTETYRLKKIIHTKYIHFSQLFVRYRDASGAHDDL